MTIQKIESALCRERNIMENENMNMIPASVPTPEATATQEKPARPDKEDWGYDLHRAGAFQYHQQGDIQ